MKKPSTILYRKLTTALAVALTLAPPVLDAANVGGLGFTMPAHAESPKLTKEQAVALATYDNAVSAFKAILAQRRAEIDAKKKLPKLPGQAIYLARLKVMSTYKDLTDALPSRIGRPNKFDYGVRLKRILGLAAQYRPRQFWRTTMHRTKSAVLAALLLIAAPTVAFTHAKMTGSVPKDGATVPAGLSKIELDFSKPLRLTVVRVMRTAEQKEIPLASELPGSFVSSAKLTVGALPAGAYEVSWTAVADDGHVMNGSFMFSVSETQPANPAQ